MSWRLHSVILVLFACVWLAACGGGSDPVPSQTGGSGGGGGSGGSGGGGGTAVCGDGQVQGEEGCDDGDANSDTAPDACRTDCTPAACGDGVRDTGEACDDGNTLPDDGCSATCASEACGDGDIDGDEECDDGNTTSGDGCSATCADEGTPSCGDGILQAGEDCDDGNEEGTDACVACAPAACGDGEVWADHEDCDDGNTTSGDGCSATCEEEGFCGDGLLDEGEDCDDGDTDDHDACRNDCTEARCGDGTIWTGEEACDDGAENSNTRADACRTDCSLPRCGDAVIDTGEGCEDGNQSTTDGCIACRVATCGDGYVRAVVEECDAGAGNSDTAPNTCRTDCRAPRCGDRVIDATESCDDGNTVPTDGCNNCQTPPVCGNGRKESGEACDDANVTTGDGCNHRCELEPGVCGAAIVDLNAMAVPGPTGFTYSGTTVGAGNDSEGSCQALDGAETVLAYFLNRRADLVLTTDASGGTRDTVIYVRRGCADATTELGCDDDSGSGSAASLVVRDVPANTQLYVVVDDGAEQAVPAPYTLTGRIVPVGGLGDACDPQGLTARCDAALFCSGTTNRCVAAVCGDGRTDPTEECDDGNTTNLDGCSARCRLEGETCGEPLVATAAGGTVTFSGSTTAARADYAAGCSPSGGNRDLVYSFTSPTAARWTFHTAASFNTVLFARRTCDLAATEFACADNSSAATGGDDLVVDLLAGETAFLFVDGYGTGTIVSQGTFTVTGTALPLRQVGESCDASGVADVCLGTAYCSAGGACLAHACGDGVTWSGHEECDDGNAHSGDGCSATCAREGDLCTAPSVATWDATAGNVTFGGNTASATANYVAGCAITVRNRDHVWSFTAPFHARYTFTSAAAFDTVLAVQGTCGSSSTNLGCSNSASGAGGDTLTVELNQGQTVTLLVDGFDGVGVDNQGAYTVTGTALPIRAVGELCDTAGVADLCDAGAYCAAGTSRCAAHVCGDGVVRSNVEECDDGNVTPFDGCSAACKKEGDVCAAPALATWDATAGNVTFAGTTVGLASNYGAGCAATDTQPDAIWRFVPPFRAKYTFTVTAATFNSVLAVQSTCGDAATNLACSNTSTTSTGGDTLTLELNQGQTVSLLVDGVNLTAGNKGTYTVVGTALPIRAVGVGCDPAGVADLCDVGAYCHPNTPVCTAHVCGDGRLYGTEQCDDGNANDLDGCTTACAFETIPEVEPNDTTATATSTYRNGRNLGVIGAAGDVDLYKVTLTGANVVYDLWAQTNDGSGTATGCPFDTTLELLGADGVALAADTDDGPGTCSQLDPAVDAGARGLAPGTYYLRVAHASSTGTSANPYRLDVRTTAKPVKATGQTCDPTGAANVCASVARCDGASRICVAHVCGDGYLWAGHETCDDGNVVPQDGCGATCALEGDHCGAVPSLNLTDKTIDPDVWTWDANTTVFTRDFNGADLTGLPTGVTCPNTLGKKDAVASFTAPVAGSYRAEITTPSYWDTVLFVTSECGGTVGLQCADAASFDVHALAAGQTIFLVVDGLGSTVGDTPAGPFTLKVTRRRCGDGVVTSQLGEQCDDSNAVNTDGCVACKTATCGDGFVRAGVEGCDDGNNVGGDGCSSHCVVEGGCGDFIVQATESCDDGGTAANDGCSATCQTETGWTCPPNTSCLPICGDGLVKGTEQCDDPNAVAWDGCTNCRTDGDSCLSAIPLAMIDTDPSPTVWVWGSTTTAFRADTGVSAPCKDSSAGKDAIYAFTAPDAATYAFQVTATWNAVLFAYDASCGGPNVLACSGSAAAGAAEKFELPMTAGQTIHVVVDGETASANGLFTLRVDKRYCGDGVISVPELCDNGPANSATAPNACRLDCRPARCGDAVTDTGERCDDGNTVDGDGCSATCLAAGLCGNGTVDAGESCDDANAAPGDGCSLACATEAGWNCAGNNCLPICGDGLVVGPEGCDDGNTVDGDGCDSTCQCPSPVSNGFSATIPSPISIPDGPAGGSGTTRTWVTATINVAGVSGKIIDADVGVTVAHGFNGDVEMQLVAPDGTTIWLADDSFGSGANAYAGVVFDDDANPTAFNTRVSSQSASPSNAQTPLQPQQALALLDNKSPNGTWTLKVADDYSGDVGTITAFSLTFKTLATLTTGAPQTFSSTTPTPIPDSAATPATSTIAVPTTAWADAYDVQVNVDIAHATPSQLTVVLVAPGNERYVLSDKRGSTCSGFLSGARFSEAATLPVNRVSTSTCPTNLVAAPESSLGKLVGVPLPGTWTLEVKDNTSGTSGTLNSWSLVFVPATCDLPR